MWGVSAGAVSQLLRKIESKKARAKMKEWEEKWWQESVTLDLTLGQIYIIYEGLGILSDTLPEESLEERRQVSSLQEKMHELLTGSSLSPEAVWSGIGKQLTPIENTAISEARLGISINQLSKRIGLIHHKTAKLYCEARRKMWAVEKSFLDSPEAQSHLDVQMLRCQIDIVENALFTLRDCRIDMKHPLPST